MSNVLSGSPGRRGGAPRRGVPVATAGVRVVLLVVVLVVVLGVAPLAAGDGVWTSTYPFGGSIPSGGLVIDPGNPVLLYAAPNWRGVYKTTDAGATWNNLLDAQPVLPFDRTGIRYLAFDAGSSTLYLAAGGLYASTDGGVTWTPRDSGLCCNVQLVAIDPTDPDTLYAAASGAALFKSTDRGASWGGIGAGTLPGDDIHSLAVDPSTPQTLYLGTAASGVYKSIDGGLTWAASNNNVTMSVVDALLVDPVDPLVVWAADNDPGTGKGIFRSTDGGASWTKLAPVLEFGGGFGRLMALDPSATDTVYAVSSGELFKTTDGGATWTSVAVAADQLSAVVVDPATPANVYVATYNRGLFRSADGGATWTAQNAGLQALNFPHSSSRSLAFDATDPAIVYAGSIPAGWRSLDGGATWSEMGFPSGLVSALASHPGATGAVWGFQGELFRSTDNGATWSGGFLCCFQEGDVALHPTDAQTLWVGGHGGGAGDGVHKSSDGGATWTLSTLGLSEPRIRVLAVDPNDGNVLYAGTPEFPGASFLFKSTDGGASWSQLGGGLPSDFHANEIVVHPADSNLVLLGAEGTAGGVYRSGDGGATWQQILAENVNAVAVDPGDVNRIYVGTWNTAGFYRSLDGGGTWALVDDGLVQQPGIEAVEVDPANSQRLLIGTTAGVFEHTFAGVVTLTVNNPADGGPGSLRDALEQANADGVANAIRFAPTMAGATIALLSPLPGLYEGGTDLDGDLDGDCTPDVAIDGQWMPGANGLMVSSDGNRIAGLAVYGFDCPGCGGDLIVLGSGAAGNLIECNHLGTDLSGTADLGTQTFGVKVIDASSGNVVRQNRILFNGTGVFFENGSSDNVVGPGNEIAFHDGPGVAAVDGMNEAFPDFTGLVGDPVLVFPVIDFTDDGGTAPFHSADGITPVDSSGSTFHDSFGARFTGSLDVALSTNYTFTLEHDDSVRLLVDGGELINAGCCGPTSVVTFLSAASHAIEIDFREHPGAARLALEITGGGALTLSTDGNLGGCAGGQAGLCGELFQLRIATDRNTITANSIHDNGGLGVNLGFDGITLNDPGDTDIGPNTLLNFPEPATVTDNGGGNYTVDGTAPADSTVEVFATRPDGAGFGEGEVLLASVVAAPSGAFSATFDLPAGFFLVTATATDPAGNTSEFSRNFLVTPNELSVTSAADSGAGTLRDALEQAASDGVPTEIGLDPALAGQTVHLLSPLPAIGEDDTTIDADLGGDCVPDLEISGALAGPANGLEIFSSRNLVRGLVVNRFLEGPGDGILIAGPGRDNVVECTYVGTDLTGELPRGNRFNGIKMTNGATGNRIGPGNRVAFNQSFGVWVDEVADFAYPEFSGLAPDFTGVFPQIDFDDGCAALQSADGILPLDGSGAPFTENVGARLTGTLTLSGGGDHLFTFVDLDDQARLVIDGTVELEASGPGSHSATVNLPAGPHAIEIDFFEGGGATHWQLQIDGPGGAGLTTDGNAGGCAGGQPGLCGELFQLRIPAEENTITENAIWDNGGLGIAFNCCCGPTLNDPGDADAGPNTALNFPELTAFTDDGGGSFTIDGTAPPDALVELFGSAPDPSGFGEGRAFLGSFPADPAGDFSATVALPASFFDVTATATDAAGNTSEFSGTLNVKQPDAVSLGGVEILQGETGSVPIFVRDLAATPLGLDRPAGDRIQGFTFQVAYGQPASVTAIDAQRAGITAGLTPLFETTVTSGNTITYIVSFSEAGNLVPFTLDAAPPGDLVAELLVTLDPAAPPTPIQLTLDAGGTLLSNQGGTLTESAAEGTLDLFGGSIVVRTRAATQLYAAAQSASEILLTWTDPQIDETGFRVERSPDGASWVAVATLGPDDTSYLDTGLSPATLYYYRVVSFSAVGDNLPSNTAAAETFPATAANVCVSRLSGDHTWARLPAAAHSGGLGVTVYQERAAGTNDEIRLQLLNPDGSPGGVALPVTQDDMMSQLPSIAWNGSRFGVTYHQTMRGAAGEVATGAYFSLFDAAGQPLRSHVRLLGPLPGGGVNNNFETELVWDGGGWGHFASERTNDPFTDPVFYRFSEEGEPIAGPVQLTSTDDFDFDVSAAWSGSEYGVAWIRRSGDSYRVLFQRRLTDGSPPAGDPGPQELWESTGGEQVFYTSVVWDGSGWAVAWTVFRFVEDEEPVYLRLVDAAGLAAGPAKRLSDAFDPEFPGQQFPVYDEVPRLLNRPGGGFVCFTSSFTFASGWEIGRLEADAAGDRVGNRRLVSDVDGWSSIFARPAFDGTDFLVAYTDNRQGSLESATVLVDAAGNTVAGPHDLTSGHSPGGNVLFKGPQNAAAAPFQGGFVVLWTDDESGPPQIQAQLFDAAGAPGPGLFPLSGRDVRGGPGLAVVGDSFAVAWKDGAQTIVFDRFDAAGGSLLGEVELAFGTGGRPQVGLAFSGEAYGVAYLDGNDVVLQRVDAAGGSLGPPTVVAGSARGPVRNVWTGAGWALLWRGFDNDLHYARVDAFGAVAVGDTPVTATGGVFGARNFDLVWSGGLLGVAWFEDRDLDPPSTEAYFTALGLDGLPVVGDVLVENSFFGMVGPPALYWDGGLFHLLTGNGGTFFGDGVRDYSIQPDGTVLGFARLSNRGFPAAVAFNGATAGLAWAQLREFFFETGACLDDATPPACPAVTLGFDDGAGVTLDWTPVDDPESGLWRYNLYRDGTQLAELFASTTSFGDGGYRPGFVHAYEVRALNGAFGESSGCPVHDFSTTMGDANGDGGVTVADVFYLINFFFAGGPPPQGDADANGDGAVTIADIFYLINFLFGGGPPPVLPWEGAATTEPAATAERPPSLLRVGEATGVPGGLVRVPVYLRQRGGVSVPEALSLKLGVDPPAAVESAALRLTRQLAGLPTLFTAAPAGEGFAALLVSFEAAAPPPVTGDVMPVAMLELRLAADAAPGEVVRLDLDAAATLLSNRQGTDVESVANGRLRLRGGAIRVVAPAPRLERSVSRRVAPAAVSER